MTPFGLDFGTTNSVLAFFDGSRIQVVSLGSPPGEWSALGFDKVFPSVIGLDDHDELTFGWSAKRQSRSKVEAVKRLLSTDDSIDLGGRHLPIEEVTSMLFAGIRQGAAEQGFTFDRSVVTIPANSRGVARFRTKLCAGIAGIEVPAFVNEPTAAAMAHSFDIADDQTILVFDWGGGTLDVTVLETVAGVFIERASKGIQRLGGIDLDAAFADAVLTTLPARPQWGADDEALFRLEIERAKVLLSDVTETNVRLPDGRRIAVTRALFEQAVRPMIDQTRGPISQCLADLGIDPAAIDHLVLVGGSSKIPLARRLVSEWLNAEPATGCDPMTAVAEGAAVASAILAGQLDKDFFVSTEHALGTIVHDAGKPGFSPIIPRNHMLPARAEGAYSPVHPGQRTVAITVVEGDPDEPLDHPSNVLLKEWTVELDQTKPHERQGFVMTYEYSVDGILHVTVTAQDDGAVMLQDDVSFGISRDRAELHRMAGRVRDSVSAGTIPPPAPGANGSGPAPALDPATASLIAKVRGILEIVTPDEADHLESLCAAVERTAGLEQSALDALTAESRKFSYLY